MTIKTAKVGLLCVAYAGIAVLMAPGLLRADDNAPPSEEAQAAALREEIPSLPHLVRTTPNIYVVQIEKIQTPEDADRAAGPDELTGEESEIRASVLSTLKGKKRKSLSLKVRQRRPGAAAAGLYGGNAGGSPEKFQHSPAFFSIQKVLSPHNPMFGGPQFETERLYLLFTDMAGTSLLGGPYGYQQIRSENAFWVRTVRKLVANPNSKHAINMSFSEFARKHRSVFIMVVGDCLGTEVSISEPIWGTAVSREEVDPARILPESAAACAGALDEKRGYLGLIEAEPWLYQVRRGYPNQSYVEIKNGMLDFSDLKLDVGFPDDGRISIADFVERVSKGSVR